MTGEERARLEAILRVPSVSALPEHALDMRACAELMAAEVVLAGGTAEIVSNGGHPLVVGEVPPSRPGPAPTVMVYGHYDVQPVGDLAEWRSPPFEPTERDGHLYARGASDDKGNLFMILVALQRLRVRGELGVRVQVLIEGEEESGGDSAERWLRAQTPDAACCLVYDSAMLTPERPAVCVGVRGILYRRLRLRAAAADGHSGIYGGAALNAAHALAEMITSLTAKDGRLAGPLRAGIAPASAAERAAWALQPSGEEQLATGGMTPADARAADEFILRTGYEPSLDVHGIECGEPGAVKTNIPAQATATLSVRLAPGQSAAAVGPVLDRLLHRATPAGCALEVERPHDADPALVPPDDPWLTRAIEGITAATGLRTVPVRSGGSIPIMPVMLELGITPILTGFALPDDGIHGPNERMRVANLALGVRAAEGILSAFGS